MLRATLVALFLSPALAAAQSPAVLAAWAWASVPTEEVPSAAASAAWAWAAVSDDGCHCGPDCGCGHGGDCKCTQRDCYTKLFSIAVKDHKPLIVGVGCEPRHVAGMLACRWDQFPDAKSPTMIVAVPDGAELMQVRTLSKSATEEEVRMAVKTSARPTAKLQTTKGGDPISGMTFPASISQLATPCANGQCGRR